MSNFDPVFSVAGKIALITGASSGLGKRFATVLAARGAKVALAARRLESLEKLAGEIVAAGGAAFATRLDVSDESSVIAAVQSVEEKFGPIDVLVNNSGISVNKPALEQTAEDWNAVVDVNLRGVFLMAREVAKRMRERAEVNGNRSGNIINIASILSTRQISNLAPYAASKAGVLQLTKSLALELSRYGIRVNAIAPGYIATDMNRRFFSSEAGLALIKRIPQRRIGEDADLDGALLLLASDASRFMTGSVVTVDGGHLVSTL